MTKKDEDTLQSFPAIHRQIKEILTDAGENSKVMGETLPWLQRAIYLLDKAEEHFITVEKSLAREEDYAQKLETRVIEIERDSADYRRRADAREGDVGTLKGEIKSLQFTLEENRRLLVLRDKERKELHQRVQDIQARAQQEKDHYEREKKDVEMTIDDLRNKVKEARRENAEILASQRTLTPPKETPMTDPKTESSMMQKIAASKAVATLKVDASEAGWRIAGSQFIKMTKEPLVALLSRHLGPDDDALRGRIAAFLDTELGTAILSAILSAGLSAVPGEPNALPAMMARELRVRSMAGAGDVIADVLMGPLRQVAVMYLQAPAEPTPAELPGSTGLVDNVVDMNTGARAKVG